MSSKRRIEASRRNGALSKGPKTAAGKSRSSQNALKHGILSERVILSIENKENFDALLAHYIEKFEPQDGVEMGMVEQMVSFFWRMQRSVTIEKQLFDQALENHTTGPDAKCLGDAFTDLANGASLKTIQRYESMLDRMHTRTLKNILLLRKMQPTNPELPNEPSPNIGHPKNDPFDPGDANEEHPAAAQPANAAAPSTEDRHPEASQTPVPPSQVAEKEYPTPFSPTAAAKKEIAQTEMLV